MTAINGKAALDRHYLEARGKVLDLAAILDRIEREGGGAQVRGDERMNRMGDALRILVEGGEGRAGRVQMAFSLEYDAAWKRP
jgi:hypothetical protein